MPLFTVADVVGQASVELGIALRAPSPVVGSNDQDVSQMVALLQAVADEVLIEEPYRVTLGDGIWLLDADDKPLLKPMADSDRILFDGRLCVAGLKFRFLKAKGLEFGEEMRDFTTRINKLAARVNGRVLDLDEDEDRAV